MDNQCLHEGNGECNGKVIAVQNLTTGRVFSMCEKHADWYYDQQQQIGERYPEIYQPEENY